MKQQAGKSIYRFPQCPFDPSHGKNEASVIQDSDGLLTFWCFHDHCNHTWEEYRSIISGDSSLAPFHEGYNPDWTPNEKKVTPFDGKPYFYLTKRGTIACNSSDFADAILKHFSPVVSEGRDYGGLLYKYHKQGIWKHLPHAEVQQYATKELDTHAKKHWIDEGIYLLENKTYKAPEQLEADPFLINVKNGMLKLPEMELIPHSSKYNSRNQLPVSYNPDAKCTLWIESLASIFADELGKADIIQQFAGYCLWPSLIFPCALLQIGNAQNGKGTVEKVLTALLGDQNVSNISLDRMQDRWGPAQLKDVLLNACSETSSKPLDATVFKAVATGDRIQCEVKYRPDVVFVPRCKHMISMNKFPKIKDAGRAFFRRIIVCEYKQVFDGSNEIKRLDLKLIKEIDGIFLWALEGLKKVLKNECITVPESVKATQNKYQTRTDPVHLFIDEECEKSPDNKITPPELYRAYCRWAEEGKMRARGKRSFYEHVEDTIKEIQRERRKANGDKCYYYYGIGTKSMIL